MEDDEHPTEPEPRRPRAVPGVGLAEPRCEVGAQPVPVVVDEHAADRAQRRAGDPLEHRVVAP